MAPPTGGNSGSSGYESLFFLLFLVGIGFLIYFLSSKRRIVYFKNPTTGEYESLKVGFNFFLFFFSSFLFGLFLYLRGLKNWGIFMTLLYLLYIFIIPLSLIAESEILMLFLISILFFIVFGCSIYLGIKGNELTGKKLLNKGFEFLDPESENVIYAKNKWNIQ